MRAMPARPLVTARAQCHSCVLQLTARHLIEAIEVYVWPMWAWQGMPLSTGRFLLMVEDNSPPGTDQRRPQRPQRVPSVRGQSMACDGLLGALRGRAACSPSRTPRRASPGASEPYASDAHDGVRHRQEGRAEADRRASARTNAQRVRERVSVCNSVAV